MAKVERRHQLPRTSVLHGATTLADVTYYALIGRKGKAFLKVTQSLDKDVVCSVRQTCMKGKAVIRCFFLTTCASLTFGTAAAAALLAVSSPGESSVNNGASRFGAPFEQTAPPIVDNASSKSWLGEHGLAQPVLHGILEAFTPAAGEHNNTRAPGTHGNDQLGEVERDRLLVEEEKTSIRRSANARGGSTLGWSTFTSLLTQGRKEKSTTSGEGVRFTLAEEEVLAEMPGSASAAATMPRLPNWSTIQPSSTQGKSTVPVAAELPDSLKKVYSPISNKAAPDQLNTLEETAPFQSTGPVKAMSLDNVTASAYSPSENEGRYLDTRTLGVAQQLRSGKSQKGPLISVDKQVSTAATGEKEFPEVRSAKDFSFTVNINSGQVSREVPPREVVERQSRTSGTISVGEDVGPAEGTERPKLGKGDPDAMQRSTFLEQQIPVELNLWNTDRQKRTLRSSGAESLSHGKLIERHDALPRPVDDATVATTVRAGLDESSASAGEDDLQHDRLRRMYADQHHSVGAPTSGTTADVASQSNAQFTDEMPFFEVPAPGASPLSGKVHLSRIPSRFSQSVLLGTSDLLRAAAAPQNTMEVSKAHEEPELEKNRKPSSHREVLLGSRSVKAGSGSNPLLSVGKFEKEESSLQHFSTAGPRAGKSHDLILTDNGALRTAHAPPWPSTSVSSSFDEKSNFSPLVRLHVPGDVAQNANFFLQAPATAATVSSDSWLHSILQGSAAPENSTTFWNFPAVRTAGVNLTKLDPAKESSKQVNAFSSQKTQKQLQNHAIKEETGESKAPAEDRRQLNVVPKDRVSSVEDLGDDQFLKYYQPVWSHTYQALPVAPLDSKAEGSPDENTRAPQATIQAGFKAGDFAVLSRSESPREATDGKSAKMITSRFAKSPCSHGSETTEAVKLLDPSANSAPRDNTVTINADSETQRNDALSQPQRGEPQAPIKDGTTADKKGSQVGAVETLQFTLTQLLIQRQKLLVAISELIGNVGAGFQGFVEFMDQEDPADQTAFFEVTRMYPEVMRVLLFFRHPSHPIAASIGRLQREVKTCKEMVQNLLRSMKHLKAGTRRSSLEEDPGDPVSTQHLEVGDQSVRAAHLFARVFFSSYQLACYYMQMKQFKDAVNVGRIAIRAIPDIYRYLEKALMPDVSLSVTPEHALLVSVVGLEPHSVHLLEKAISLQRQLIAHLGLVAAQLDLASHFEAVLHKLKELFHRRPRIKKPMLPSFEKSKTLARSRKRTSEMMELSG